MTNKPHTYIKTLLATFMVLVSGAISTLAQQEQQYNRFQYHKYSWQQYDGKNFHIYFTNGSDSLYSYLKQEVPFAMAKMKKNMLTDLQKELNVIVYPSVDQLYESNIGSFETQQFTLPTFVSKASRLVLAYNGSYEDLHRQLYEALARSQWESQMKEGGLDDQAKSKTGTQSKSATAQIKSNTTDIPMWYKEGAIRYFASQWPVAAEDKLRQSFEAKHFTGWQQVLNYEPRLGGQAFCYYLSEKYFPTINAQIFLQLRKKKSLPRVIRLVTKHSLDSLYGQCYDYYRGRFAEINSAIQSNRIAKVIPHKEGVINNILLSPDERRVLYTLVTLNKRTVYLYDFTTKENRKIYKYLLAPWIDDHSADQYPLLAWQPEGNKFYITIPEKGKMTIHSYSSDGSYIELTKLYGVDGAKSIQCLDERRFLLTGYTKGQSDIVTYNDNGGTYTAYTDDTYDDSSPLFDKSGNLLFISNRPKDNKPKPIEIGKPKPVDTLWQGIYEKKGKEIVPVAIDTLKYVKRDKLTQLTDGNVLFTNTEHGIEQNYLLKGNRETQLGNYSPYQYNEKTKKVYQYNADKDSIYITEERLNDWLKENKTAKADTTSPWLKDYRKRAERQAKEDAMLRAAKDTTHYVLDDILKPARTEPADKKGKKKKQKEKPTKKSEISPYVLQLHSAYFTAKVNNDYFMNRYQPYLNYQGQYKFPEIGGMAQGGFTDLFENHRFTIAYRLPAATQGSDFFVKYDHLSQKLDWGLTYYRKVDQLQPDPQRNWVDDNGNPYPNTAKVKTHYYEFNLHHPLTYDCSLAFSEAIRKDKTIFLATDKYSLDFAPIESVWSITSLSFKINKLKPTIPFLNKGFKATAYLDGFQGFTQKDAALFGSSINAQYHQPLYKYITLVLQGHMGYSGGIEKVLYNLGGKDNNVTPKVDTAVHFSQTAPYAFQELVTPFRGYFQNSLYGNRYLLFNTDIYFPIFQTLYPLQTPLPSINNLQLGLLCDAATASETWNNNPKNNQLIYSYGLSGRTMLAGYPIRVDVAWPGSFSKKPVWYFTLNLQ